MDFLNRSHCIFALAGSAGDAAGYLHPNRAPERFSSHRLAQLSWLAANVLARRRWISIPRQHESSAAAWGYSHGEESLMH
jgi:hypothetical protein